MTMRALADARIVLKAGAKGTESVHGNPFDAFMRAAPMELAPMELLVAAEVPSEWLPLTEAVA